MLVPARRFGAFAVALAAAAALLLLAVPAAMAGPIAPEAGGSPNADDIRTLYWITLGIGSLVFLAVEGMLIYCLIHYRSKRRQALPKQIRGNTRLEILWTAGAAGILVVLAIATFVMLNDIVEPPESGASQLAAGASDQLVALQPQRAAPEAAAFTVEVNGQQYMWRYDYPSSVGDNVFAFYEMVVPTNTVVNLNITSQDVQHSWWIPRLGGKADATPGHVNHAWFRIPEAGVYDGQCAELCGENHAEMWARVRAVPPAEFLAWAQRREQAIEEAQVALARDRAVREGADDAPGGAGETLE